MRHALSLLLTACAFFVMLPAHGQTQFDPPSLYRLRVETTYQIGCFDPCDCPLLVLPLEGEFLLDDAGFDGLFFNFTVREIDWRVRSGSNELRIRGSGRYRFGGEFAAQQQLSLELRVNDEEPRWFDSGLVPHESGIFPRIDVSAAVGDLICFDERIDLHARPAPRLYAERTGLFWRPVLGARDFDLVSGSLRALRASGGDFFESLPLCVANDFDGLRVLFESVPVIDPEGRWYLLRYNGNFGADSYDTDLSSQRGTRDPGINMSPGSCP